MYVKGAIRYPAVAGLFYPAREADLSHDIKGYLADAEKLEGLKRITGIVAPHAGYMYSGAVAAQAYRQLEDRAYDTVVVVSPSHRAYFREISVYQGEIYKTPLGDVKVDVDAAEALAEASTDFILSNMGHDEAEHALEVQLPFLQSVLNDFKLVPLVMGDQGAENVKALAEALHQVLRDKKVLLVASSDLSHFHSSRKAGELDKQAVAEINKFDDQALQKILANGKSEMCGGGPALSVMRASKMMGARNSKVLQYKTSGDVTGDHSQVVGYLSAIFFE